MTVNQKLDEVATGQAPSVAQRLYDLITAMDRVDTLQHIRSLAWALQYFRSDVLDVSLFAGDAPHLKSALKSLELDAYFNAFGKMPTYPAQFDEGIATLEAHVEFQRGLLREISALFLQVFKDARLHRGSDLRLHREELPLVPLFEQRGPHKAYNCVYIWMVGTSGELSLDRLVDAADCRDRELVEKFVKPCIYLAPLERLDDFIVCVAGTREEALRTIEADNEYWRRSNAESIRALVETVEPRHVVLLDTIEPPHVVFNWALR